MLQELGCYFGINYDSFTTMFKHPTYNYFVYAIFDPCHMLKLSRNALTKLKSFKDPNNDIISWHYFSLLQDIVMEDGFNLASKFIMKHIQFQKKKMNVALAAQALTEVLTEVKELVFKKQVPLTWASVKF